MSTEPAAFRVEVLLSFQRALWDMVTPALRGVAVRYSYPTILARFIYETLGGDETMLVAEVETYVLADFAPLVDVRCIAVAVPPSAHRDLAPGEEWVYLRRESEVL
jgi:hypothetical protein